MKTLIAMMFLVGVAHADDRCVVEKPLPTPVGSAKPASCHRASAKLAKSITAEIVKEYLPEQGGKPEVKFPCDGLGAKIYEIVIETGNGHGGTLSLWRARRRPDGTYDARGILYKRGAKNVQASGTVAVDLERVRAAMTAKVREVVPPAKPGEFRGMKSSFSSYDFHHVIRLVDDDGRVAERRYTGYESSDKQDTYLGLQIAMAALAPITSLPENTSPADADDKLFFAASFNAAVPMFDEPFHWWVMERYVELARFLGTPAIIGGLLTRLAPKKLERSQIDARADAVEAIANITGWDARAGGKSVEDAAKTYLAACR